MPSKVSRHHQLLFRYLSRLSLLFFLLFYPGQNFYQTLSFSPSRPQIAFFIPPLQPLPLTRPISRHLPPPPLSAQAVVVQDLQTKAMLYLKNPNRRLFPASTTKIMTALVALETYSLDQTFRVSLPQPVIGHTIGLVDGEVITLKSLLYGLLIASGNDAALVLAQNHPQGYSGFVQAMNRKAQQLGLTQTHFTNPSGLTEADHYTSARDLAILTSTALSHPLIKQIVSLQKATITDLSGQIKHYLVNTNLLLGKLPEVKGFKTGWTPQAGECLVTYLELDHHPVVIVLLGSTDRFGETLTLIHWLKRNYYWYNKKL